MAGQSGFSLRQDRGTWGFSAYVEKRQRTECVESFLSGFVALGRYLQKK